MKLTELKKIYEKRTVLDVDNFSFEDGKIYALVGANGSGKSTLLKILDGQLKPNGGKIELGDIRKEKIGYMPQKNFAFSLSVINNMLLNHMTNERRMHKTRADSLLREFSLHHLRKINASRLSGGETQRLALARLFMDERKLLLLDEPTASMDIQSASVSETALKNYCASHHPTVVFATHSLQQAKRISDCVIFMDGGKIVEFGTPEDVFDRPVSELTRNFLNFIP